MADQDQKGKWLSSKEAMAHLKITGCELMHRRGHGELKFEKRDRAYFYFIESKDE